MKTILLTLLLATLASAATYDEYTFTKQADRQKVVLDYGSKQVRVSHFLNDMYTGKVDKYDMAKFSDVTNSIVKSGFSLTKETKIDLLAEHAKKLAAQKILDAETDRLNAQIAASRPAYTAPRYTYTPSTPKQTETPSRPEPSLQNPEIRYSSYRDYFTQPVISTSSARHGVNVQYNSITYKHVNYGGGRTETYRNGELVSRSW